MREASRILEIQLPDHMVCGDAKSDPQGRGFTASVRRACYQIRPVIPHTNTERFYTPRHRKISTNLDVFILTGILTLILPETTRPASH